ncbi:MAG: RNA methyltransferase [Verrucomicrobia bacterium]|nr:RNA methyltransferase [Verrucomicrobiota bacterium]MCG2680847.1 RNA methyltransferase [Kiritimatiellia bacterium]MBU4246857.1 RNA methyltransferase [Verrucomicrobiota bacterium]MBU4290397.1 RNA methyltransferase [Verrucomicrobiota bacterium]MBU4430248.1 RNA methyltransferase [Verrucomicrobiota bacterium]
MAEEYIHGMNPAFEVIRARRRRIHKAYLQEGAEASARMKKLASMLETLAVSMERVTKQRLFQLCKSSEHQGIVLTTDSYPYVPFESLLTCPRLLLLDNVEDPQNVGAILRSAEVFGWEAVLLSAKGVPEVYPSVVKASAGASEHLRIARDCPANAYVKELLEQGYILVALDEHGKEDIQAIRDRAPEKLLLVIGGEHRSVGQHILNQARHIVGIPQKGRIQSLNASVAAGIALFVLGKKAGSSSEAS